MNVINMILSRLGIMLIDVGRTGLHHIRIRQTFFVAAVVLMPSLQALSDALAAEPSGPGIVSTKVFVTASVKPFTSFRIIRQPLELVVTNADIRRGFVEVAAASLIEVKSNTAGDHLIYFEGIEGPFKEVFVQGLGRDVKIVSGQGWVLRPYTKGTAALELSYRFVLSENVHPGTYAWPLSISTRPL